MKQLKLDALEPGVVYVLNSSVFAGIDDCFKIFNTNTKLKDAINGIYFVLTVNVQYLI